MQPFCLGKLQSCSVIAVLFVQRVGASLPTGSPGWLTITLTECSRLTTNTTEPSMRGMYTMSP